MPAAFLGTLIFSVTPMTSATVVATAHDPLALGYPGGAVPGMLGSIAVCVPLKYGAPVPLPVQLAEGDGSSHVDAYPELSTPRLAPSRGTMTLRNDGRMPCCPALGAVVAL